MKGYTHLTFGGTAAALVAASVTTDPTLGAIITVAGMVGSLVPDIDHPASMISGYPLLGLVSVAMRAAGTRHRTWTHSLLALLGLVALCYALHPLAALGMAIGAGSHLLLDMLTPSGVPLLWPIGGAWRLAPARVLAAVEPILDVVLWVGIRLGLLGLIAQILGL